MGAPVIFTPAHLAIIAAVPLAAGALAAWVRRWPGAARPVRLAPALAIGGKELVWYGYVMGRGWMEPPAGLPLDLCDVVPWLTVFALATTRRWALEAVYFLALAGSGMAVLTPDVGAPFPSYPAIQFFLAHGGVVASVLFLLFTGTIRPRRGAWWRVLAGLNAYAAVIALVDARYGTNYLYLREKPASATLLDLLGPWPWYVLSAEVVAVALFCLLDLPFRRAATKPALRAGSRPRAIPDGRAPRPR